MVLRRRRLAEGTGGRAETGRSRSAVAGPLALVEEVPSAWAAGPPAMALLIRGCTLGCWNLAALLFPRMLALSSKRYGRGADSWRTCWQPLLAFALAPVCRLVRKVVVVSCEASNCFLCIGWAPHASPSELRRSAPMSVRSGLSA